jgi:hypothetical protein
MERLWHVRIYSKQLRIEDQRKPQGKVTEFEAISPENNQYVLPAIQAIRWVATVQKRKCEVLLYEVHTDFFLALNYGPF